MTPFTYERATAPAQAVSLTIHNSKYIAGGTNLLDLMKIDVERPHKLIDVSRLPLTEITSLPNGGGVRLGALATNADTAHHPLVQSNFPLLSMAILAGASPQLRNMATNGGNLLQRTRCYYFYDVATPCNKRDRGSGCAALTGINRIHAILGASEHCVATHPSDMCVALRALSATINVTTTQGDASIPIADFHRLPGETPHLDTNLPAGALITYIDLPTQPPGFSKSFSYVKVRDRASYAFALVSVAAALHIEKNTITHAAVALGGVAHKPWRNEQAESLLLNKPPTPDTFAPFATALLHDAKPLPHNTFKLPLAHRAILRALEEAANLKPKSLPPGLS